MILDYKKNDLVTVTIEDMGNEGEGIGRAEGYTLFVKDAVVGDIVQARIVKPKKSYAYARLERILQASPFRVEPKCSCHRQCGGCQLQTLAYEKQLQFKQEKIRNNLIRIGGFEEALVDRCMEPIIGMEEPWRYRNKAQYPIGRDRDGKLITGFYAGRTHSIIANTDCALGAAENRVILENILEYMRENEVSTYDETTGEGLVRHVLIRKGFTSGEIMVCLVINGTVRDGQQQDAFRKNGAERVVNGRKKCSAASYQEAEETHSATVKRVFGTEDSGEYLPAQKKLLQRLQGITGMTSISVSVNRERSNVIMGKEIHNLWGSSTIKDTIHVRDMEKPGCPLTGRELTFHISPLSFYQVNPIQTEKLYSLALEYAALSGQETVWDLYCGIGTISLFLAESARKVCGVEIIPEAIQDARENAARNGITNVEFFTGRAEEVLPAFYAGSGGARTVFAAGVQDPGPALGVTQKSVDAAITDIVGKTAESGQTSDAADMRHPDVIVVDPPRKGCDAACLATMLAMRPDRIVYISCDSATLARDLKILCDGGYEIKRVRGVDQFGMTVHVETVCLLCKLNVEHHIEAEVNFDKMI